MVIEDAPDGVRAAKAASAKFIAVTNTITAENLSAADFICDSIEEISLGTIIGLIEA